MSKELEEVIKYFEKISKEWKTMGNTQIEAAKKLEIILQALKNSIPKEKVENKIEELKHKQIGAITGIYGVQVDILEELLKEEYKL